MWVVGLLSLTEVYLVFPPPILWKGGEAYEYAGDFSPLHHTFQQRPICIKSHLVFDNPGNSIKERLVPKSLIHRRSDLPHYIFHHFRFTKHPHKEVLVLRIPGCCLGSKVLSKENHEGGEIHLRGICPSSLPLQLTYLLPLHQLRFTVGLREIRPWFLSQQTKSSCCSSSSITFFSQPFSLISAVPESSTNR